MFNMGSGSTGASTSSSLWGPVDRVAHSVMSRTFTCFTSSALRTWIRALPRRTGATSPRSSSRNLFIGDVPTDMPAIVSGMLRRFIDDDGIYAFGVLGCDRPTAVMTTLYFKLTTGRPPLHTHRGRRVAIILMVVTGARLYILQQRVLSGRKYTTASRQRSVAQPQSRRCAWFTSPRHAIPDRGGDAERLALIRGGISEIHD